MRKIIILLFLFNSLLYAQDVVIDSLKNNLKDAKNDIEKVQSLNAIANQYKYSNPDEMLKYANEALQLAQKIKYKVEEGNALLNIGTSSIIKGEYDNASHFFIQAKELFEEEQQSNISNEVKLGLAKTYGSLGIVFSEQSNYSKAIQYYLKSVKIYEALQEEVFCGKLYNNIGVVYKSQHSEFKALEYFLKASTIQIKHEDPNSGITYTNIANIYLSQKQYDKALEYYSLAKVSLDKYPNYRALGEWYNNMGLYYNAKQLKEEAFENWQQAIHAFQSINDKFGLTDTYLFLGEYFLENEELDKAIINVNRALSLSKEIEVLEQQSVAEKLLSIIYEKGNNTSLALNHFKQYTILSDSLVNEANIRKSVEAAMNYEFEKKELFQKEENEKRELLLKEQAKQFKLKLFYVGLIVLLLFGIVFLIYNRMQLKKTLTLQKELAEYEQKALHLQMNPHFVFNCLGSISSFIVQNGTDSAIKYLSKFSKLMRLTLEYSKESLIPIDKEIESLQNYLELEQLRFNHKFNFSISKSNEIEDDVALPPLLIQPFIENAIIHGVIPKKEEGIIQINFSIKEETLICVISDNGVGINKSKENKENLVLAHKSMALDIIKKRLEMIASSTQKNATMQVEEILINDHVEGTKVILYLPLQYIQ
ncbi:tetratricopeptide repeat protein [Flavobacterium sp. J27]|uniref:tetratricopeptide repeat-containing sensor histidine kinase n=1 Tax=Flavobacterium sp. J27 TaxID=2060419 RepID=UPI0013EE8FDE|nr:tetratricopeptide repeat protein [Flavobacterium sp. J27]